ncbi:MAG: CotH kinase family protein [Saprospiraceae bacterium]|nr:CotH kinase family protein [Saprospiraceae bacterium]
MVLGWLLLAASGEAKPPDSTGLDPFHLYDIRLEIADKNWEKKLKAYRATDRPDKIPATLTMDGVRLDSVGIRFKGNSSFNSVRKKGDRKLPFSLDANEFVKGQEFPTGHRGLKLSNGFRDPSYLRDVLSFQIARQYMPAPQCAMARVWVNGEYFGVYTLTEDIDKAFLAKWMGDRDGVFFKCDPEWQIPAPQGCPVSDQCSLEPMGKEPICYARLYEMKSERGWEDLLALIDSLDRDRSELTGILDVDRALWMLAFNNLFVNLDSYTGRLCHNYFLYRQRDGLFVPLIWDLNLSLGGFRMADKTNLSNDEMIRLDPLLHAQNPRRPLIQRLLEHPLYRKIYLAHMHTMLEETVLNGAYKEWMEEWHQLLDKAVKEEKMALYPYDHFKRNKSETVENGGVSTIGIEILMDARATWLCQHPLWQNESPRADAVDVWSDSLLVHFRLDACVTQQVYLMWKPAASGKYRSLPLLPGVLTGGFEGCLPKEDLPGGADYYFVLENEHRVTHFPRRASAAPLHYCAEN